MKLVLYSFSNSVTQDDRHVWNQALLASFKKQSLLKDSNSPWKEGIKLFILNFLYIALDSNKDLNRISRDMHRERRF
jgi:hypothetical protein